MTWEKVRLNDEVALEDVGTQMECSSVYSSCGRNKTTVMGPWLWKGLVNETIILL